MFITRKHISRRKVLRGAGVTLALPFLDSMVPAFAQSAGKGAPRFVGIFSGQSLSGRHYRPVDCAEIWPGNVIAIHPARHRRPRRQYRRMRMGLQLCLYQLDFMGRTASAAAA